MGVYLRCGNRPKYTFRGHCSAYLGRQDRLITTTLPPCASLCIACDSHGSNVANEALILALRLADVAVGELNQYPSRFLPWCCGLDSAYCSGRELDSYMDIVPVGLLLKVVTKASETKSPSNAADNIICFAKNLTSLRCYDSSISHATDKDSRRSKFYIHCGSGRVGSRRY